MTCVLLIYKIFKWGFLHDSKRADTYPFPLLSQKSCWVVVPSVGFANH